MAEYFPLDVSNIGSYSGSFSGSFFGNGSGLTNIKSSNISGSVTSASYALTASYLSSLESELNNVLVLNLFIS